MAVKVVENENVANKIFRNFIGCFRIKTNMEITATRAAKQEKFKWVPSHFRCSYII